MRPYFVRFLLLVVVYADVLQAQSNQQSSQRPRLQFNPTAS